MSFKSRSCIQSGNVFYDKKVYEKAAENYKKGIEKEPEVAVYHSNLILTYTQLNKPDEAEKAYSKAIDIDPANPVYLNQLGDAFYENWDNERAAEQYVRALEIDPEVRDYIPKLIITCERLSYSNKDKALSLLQTAAKYGQDNVELIQAIDRLKGNI
ncbi:MAG TPA: tetratricopeptide repeat protein [Thermodesulfobacteriota bacterium]|nr:tetratricopeptide repeat protein [Thermodesulfobacteriota bacterium]